MVATADDACGNGLLPPCGGSRGRGAGGLDAAVDKGKDEKREPSRRKPHGTGNQGDEEPVCQHMAKAEIAAGDSD